MRGEDSVSTTALRAVFGGSPDLAIATDPARQVTFANTAATARWPAAVGSQAEALFPEADRERFVAAVTAVLASGTAARFEWGELGPGGVTCWFQTALSRIEGGLLCLSTDVTEAKRTEQRLRRSEELMVDTQGVAHLGTWDWDISLPNATWSAELYRIYGLTPETYTPSYEAYLTMIHPDDRQRVIDATNRVFHEHIPYSHDERIFRPDGSIRHLHTWAHPVLDQAGKLTRLVGVCQDITDQKLAEEALQQLNVELERRVAERTAVIETSMRDLEAFNAMISHDLRAPLAVIQMASDLIERQTGPVASSIPQNLHRIRRSVEQMNALIESLMTLARVGQSSLEYVEVDLSSLCTEIVAELRSGAPDRTVEIVIEPRLTCRADAGLLGAVMTNLLHNAWKYSARVAQARIEVRAYATDDGRGFLVTDNGAGFDMKQVHRLFTPFQRLHESAEFAGTGVGLATVQRIVERHGGRIWAESEPGRGASFYVILPARDALAVAS